MGMVAIAKEALERYTLRFFCSQTEIILPLGDFSPNVSSFPDPPPHQVATRYFRLLVAPVEAI